MRFKMCTLQQSDLTQMQPNWQLPSPPASTYDFWWHLNSETNRTSSYGLFASFFLIRKLSTDPEAKVITSQEQPCCRLVHTCDMVKSMHGQIIKQFCSR